MTNKTCPMLVRLAGEEENPGDVFIAMGLQQILSEALEDSGTHVNWINISKFDPAHIKRHLGLVREAGFLIIGGTPQYNNYDDWCFWYDKELWEDFIVPAGIKTFPLAGGGGYPSNTMSPEDFSKHCLKSAKTQRILDMRCKTSPFFTVRDHHAHALLKSLPTAPEVHLLGCTATFASMAMNVEWQPKDLLIVVHPSPSLIPDGYLVDPGESLDEQAMHAEKSRRAIKLIRDCGEAIAEDLGLPLLHVAHGIKEYMSLKQAGIPDKQVFFTNDCYRLLGIYRHASHVFSCRLHGALPAFGMCGPRVVHVGVDTRMSAIDYFPGIPNIKIQELTPGLAVDSMKHGSQPWSQAQRHEEFWDNQMLFYRERIRREGFLQ